MFIQLPSVIGQPVICWVMLHVWEFAITALSESFIGEQNTFTSKFGLYLEAREARC